MGHKLYVSGRATWVRFETNRAGAEPNAPPGIGSTSSLTGAEEKRRPTGSTSCLQQLKKKKLLLQGSSAWSCHSSFVSSLTAAFARALFTKP